VIAYLLLVHTSPRQVARLIEALNGPDVIFFVHVDRKVDTGQFRYMVRHYKNVKFVWPRLSIEWGGWNMVEAELTMVRWALRFGATHLSLLSGMDYPAWSNTRLREILLNTDKSYMEHFRIPSAFWDRGAVNRVRQYWLCDDPFPIRNRLWRKTVGRVWRGVWNRVIRKYSNLALKVGFELGIHRKPPNGLIPYVGSQWWSLSRGAAQYVVDYAAEHPEVIRFYRHCHVPDEGFFQTVLMNSPLRDTIEETNLRYVEWDGSFNPRVLELSDLEAIVRSGNAFARKVVLGAAKEPNGRVASSDALIKALDQRRETEEASHSSPTPTVDAKSNGTSLHVEALPTIEVHLPRKTPVN
jgi:hypothetical protein